MYERQRRKRLATQRRSQQTLSNWLEVMYPQISKEFGVFFRTLSERNQFGKDLTKTVDFRRFLSEGSGK